MAASRPVGSAPTARLTASLLALLALSGSGCARVGLEPELEAAWVALRPAGAEVARVAKVELPAGTEFTLHAVVEARGWRGGKIYFTEAPALEIDGRRVPDEEIRPWGRGLRARILWFTVEGFPPYGERLELGYREVFQGDWPLAWSVAGVVDPAVENYLPEIENPRRGPRFGTQRYRVRVEVLGPESEILPRRSLESWGADRLPQDADRFPGVVAELPGALASLSRAFGLPQREPAAGPDRAMALARVADWQASDLAFSRLTLLRRWVDSLAIELEDLPWLEVDLEGASPWGEAGEPLRVGERIVWLLEDRGVVGSLDRGDLCLDFEKGARVRILKDIFTGDGLVERARLPRPAAPRG